ncbi:polysaccharide deacetylase family protein [Paenibacillus sp. YPG26]|uniref:polysaccharide deacetylase family protein n=1 Tax=Paenibacillus sp. YPG26 TaxID=2878915 RepID=UPI002040BAFD|nr:polysaccharide deacetylase family protein [Paenibacillus sp. YPG26]USB34743.1 polysaccharide deacetylase family protein [Paenibacillus sp. YPG26]
MNANNSGQARTQTQAEPTAPLDKPAQDTDTNADNKPGTRSPAKDDQNKASAVPEIKYHMNKAYNIVPNEKGVESKVVLLTFDDGPKDQKWINGIIDVLDKHKAKAIFFVNGYRIKENPELLKLIHDRGQPIGNHSWDHISLKSQPLPKVRKQIEDVQKTVKELTGETPVFFRPPFGEGGETARQVAKENKLLYMTWSNGSLDWTLKTKNKSTNPDKVVKNVLDQLHPGANILMHELPWTVEALDTLLTKLTDKGYSFVDPASISLEPPAATGK